MNNAQDNLNGENKMTNTERTMKFFGITEEKANEMLNAANARNERVAAKGALLSSRIGDSKHTPYIVK